LLRSLLKPIVKLVVGMMKKNIFNCYINSALFTKLTYISDVNLENILKKLFKNAKPQIKW
jgi:hypothetical protein